MTLVLIVIFVILLFKYVYDSVDFSDSDEDISK